MTEEAVVKRALPADLAASEGGHVVQFYEQSPYLVDRVSAFIAPGLQAGKAAIVMATPEHREMIEVQLRARGIDVAEMPSRVPMSTSTPPRRCREFMVAGQPDRRRFVEVVGGIITQARPKAQFPIVRAFGEMVALLWAQGRQDAAISLLPRLAARG